MIGIVGMWTATLLALAYGAANGIPKGWVNNFGYSYKVFNHRATFEEAEAVCVAEGGHLASIHSQEENEFIYSITDPHEESKSYDDLLWIGLRQKNWPKDKKWTWTDGTLLDFINWGAREPNNLNNAEHCVQCVDAETVRFLKP
nr:C-type lectin domain containing protein [Haemonchus contortus]